jgi:pyruvate dehydrogenase E1 component
VQLLGSGTIFREVIAAADLLKNDWGVEADLWSCPSFNELAREGQDVERWNLLHPTEAPRESFVARSSRACAVRSSRRPTTSARSPSRSVRSCRAATWCWAPTASAARTPAKLRHFFEVDRHWVTVAALKALADEGAIGREKVAEAIEVQPRPEQAEPDVGLTPDLHD